MRMTVSFNLSHMHHMRCLTRFGTICTIKKNVTSTHGVLLSVKLQALALACNYIKINTLLWVFFTFFILDKWWQITQYITYYYRRITTII